jgi:hypoxanthine phosphoribosyltransferase
MPFYEEKIGKVLIDEDTLQDRLTKLGAQITQDYKDCGDLLLICVLRGGVLFLTDLMRNIDLPLHIDFMAVSSYDIGMRESSGRVRINFDLKTDIFNRDVLVVEDIIDSGHTLSKILEMLETRQPRSLRVCTLLDKAERREVEIEVHYTGFQIPDEFVVGYGLDYDEYYRNVPFIGVMSPDAA